MIDINEIAKDILVNEGCTFVGMEDEKFEVYQNDKIRIKKGRRYSSQIWFSI